MSVDTIHVDYANMLSTWTLMKDVCISEKHMHDQGNKYVPTLDGMTTEQYTAYVNRAEFPMFTKHALSSFVGMAMRKDLLITGIDVDHDFFKNCDGKGTSLKGYSRRLVREFLQYRRCGTLVEYPQKVPGMSVADAEKANMRVKLSYYNHLSIINWKQDVINNEEMLTLVVLKEEIDVSTDDFTHQVEDRYRVLKMQDGIYIQRLYNSKGEQVGEDIVPEMDGKPLKEIPFIMHGGVSIETPAMLPIAEQNIHWYMKDADYQHGLHYVALPTPVTTGVDSKNAPSTIGCSKIWHLPDGANAFYLEFSGDGLGQIEKSMQDSLTNITMLSSQILVPKNTFDETATAASIRNATETASLSDIVSDLSNELTTAVIIASTWGKFFVENTTVNINSDFIPLTLSGADVSAYVSAVLKGGFSTYTLFSLLKKGEIQEGDRQYEDEMKDIEDEMAKRKVLEVAHAKALTDATATEPAPGRDDQVKDKPSKQPADEPDDADDADKT